MNTIKNMPITEPQKYLGGKWLYAGSQSSHEEINFEDEQETQDEQYIRNSTFFYINSILEKISNLNIKVPETATIRQYLQKYPDIIDVLLFACRKASKRFSSVAQLSLELFSDYEFKDEYPTLYIRQEIYDENLFEQIRELRSEYNTTLTGLSGEFLVTTDFASPRE